jgi:hypothetical protein
MVEFELRWRVRGRMAGPNLNVTYLTNLGIRHYSLGDNQQAIDLDTRALTIARDLGDRQGEGMR